jgi:NAD dependent epimerase/dehydratase family enzyme
MALMPSSIWRVNPSPINAGRQSRNSALPQPLGYHPKAGQLFNASDTPPAVLISGSATGYYGDLGEVVVTEEEPPHNEFTLAPAEQIACEAQSDRTRVCLLRTGVVLAPRGGILAK